MDTRDASRAGRLRAVVFGTEDSRVRATWRVLLAMPVLWSLTGGVLTGNLNAAVGFIPSGGAPGSGLAASLVHAVFLVGVLVPWARYIDWVPLSNYGISVSLRWVREFLLGFIAVVLGQSLWILISSLPGGKSAQISVSTPEGSVLVWLVIPFVALTLHAAVQQVVFFRVILKNAAEGLHSRGMNATQAVLMAVLVAAVFFIAMHGSTVPMRIFDLALVGGIFGLLYSHTGRLGFGIGAHFGAFYAGTVVFGVIQMTGALPGVLGVIDQYGFPKMVFAYLLLLAWLRLRRGEVPLQSAIARWRGRQRA